MPTHPAEKWKPNRCRIYHIFRISLWNDRINRRNNRGCRRFLRLAGTSRRWVRLIVSYIIIDNKSSHILNNTISTRWDGLQQRPNTIIKIILGNLTRTRRNYCRPRTSLKLIELTYLSRRSPSIKGKHITSARRKISRSRRNRILWSSVNPEITVGKSKNNLIIRIIQPFAHNHFPSFTTISCIISRPLEMDIERINTRIFWNWLNKHLSMTRNIRIINLLNKRKRLHRQSQHADQSASKTNDPAPKRHTFFQWLLSNRRKLQFYFVWQNQYPLTWNGYKISLLSAVQELPPRS